MRPAFVSARRARPQLGTFVEITAGGATPSAVHAAIDAAFDGVADVHRLMSFHDPGSDLSRINRDAATRPVTVHPWTLAVLRAALELHDASGGIFDVTVAPVLQGLGRLPGQAEARVPHPHLDAGPGIEVLAARRVRFRHPGVAVDLGGIAKGFAVDRALDILRKRGMTRGLVNAGGDLAAFGRPGECISIRDPRQRGASLGCVRVEDTALASSGGGEAVVVDPRRGEPAGGVLGATVTAQSCLLADALTKVVMVAGEGAGPLLARYGAAALFLSVHGAVHVTRGWSTVVCRAS